MYDIVIIGGGPAGLTAALYARRQGKTALVIEKNSFGGQTVFSPKIENYPGYAEMSGTEFSDRLVDQVISQGAELTVEEVLSIRDGQTKTVVTDSGEYTCRSIIIATGARHRLLGIEREENFIGNGISFCAVCDGAFYKGKHVLLIGGGNSALVEANLLAETVASLTIVQNLPVLTGEQALASEVTAHENVRVIYNSVVKEIVGRDTFDGVVIENTATGENVKLHADGMFVAIGLVPDTGAFGNTVTLDANGYIDADERCLTNRGGIFVAGDCRAKQIRQITTACADGAVAALAACKYVG